jgi:hypothetical protein
MTTSAQIVCSAKVSCTAKAPAGEGQTRLGFSPDYLDGRNAEWAKYTPGLTLAMTVLDRVADKIAMGQAITLLFTIDDDDQAVDQGAGHVDVAVQDEDVATDAPHA